MIFKKFASCFALLFAAIACSAQTITTFDVSNSTATYPIGINSAGQITGYYRDNNGQQHGFVRDRHGRLDTFDVAGSLYNFADAINAADQITGYYLGADGIYHGFLRNSDRSVTSFDVPATANPGQGIFPQAINSRGQITGYYVAADYIYHGYHGYLRKTDGTITAIEDDPSDPGTPGFCGGQPCSAFLQPQAINAKGQITGLYYENIGIDTYVHGFLRNSSGLITKFDPVPVDPVHGTFAKAINAEGEVTGNYGFGKLTGFLRQTDGTSTTFDACDSAIQTFPTAINSEHQTTGFCWDGGSTHGFLRNSDGIITNFDVGSGNTFATGINARGQITGYYQDTNFIVHGFVRDK